MKPEFFLPSFPFSSSHLPLSSKILHLPFFSYLILLSPPILINNLFLKYPTLPLPYLYTESDHFIIRSYQNICGVVTSVCLSAIVS